MYSISKTTINGEFWYKWIDLKDKLFKEIKMAPPNMLAFAKAAKKEKEAANVSIRILIIFILIYLGQSSYYYKLNK